MVNCDGRSYGILTLRPNWTLDFCRSSELRHWDAKKLGLLLINPVAVEKLARQEFAEITSRQEALQTIFPSLLDIFYHPIFDFFHENRLFQQPLLFARNIKGAHFGVGFDRSHHHLPKGAPL
jgi:hypothetical protein